MSDETDIETEISHCIYCCNLDRSNASWFDDSPAGSVVTYFSIEIFRQEAENGCRYCALVLRALDLSKLQPADGTKPRLKLHHDRAPLVEIHPWTPKTTRTAGLMLFRTTSTVCEGEDVPNIRVLPSIKTNAVDAMDMIKGWLRQCMNEHAQCSPSQAQLDPKAGSAVRMLLHFEEGQDSVRLVKVKNEHRMQYAALSYCWGGDQPMKLTSSTEGAWLQGLPIKELALLHQDAVMVCKCLGVEYLWVDAFCIRQDDERDWAEQSASMAAIYDGAVFTIQAAACKSPQMSLFTVRKDPNYESTDEPVLQSSSGCPLVAVRSPVNSGIHFTVKTNAKNLDPLHRRGWAFQEAALSRRIISFTHREVQWLCRSKFACECQDLVNPDFRKSMIYSSMPAMSTSEACNLWRTYVQRYTLTRLSRRTDRLVAISGLAKTLSRHIQGQYLAGIWEADAIRGLLWTSPASSSDTRTPVKPYRAPSFSWASLEGQVLYVPPPEFLTGTLTCFAEVIAATCQPKTSLNPFGEVCDGSLTIRGKITSCSVGGSGVPYGNPDDGPPFTLTDSELPLGDVRVAVVIDCDIMIRRTDDGSTASPMRNDQDNVRPSDIVVSYKTWKKGHHYGQAKCLRLARMIFKPHAESGLITEYLMLLGPSQRHPGCYERLGMALLEHSSSLNFPLPSAFKILDDLAEETITLV